MIEVSKPPFKEMIGQQASGLRLSSADLKIIEDIQEKVKEDGDKALIQLTQSLDKVTANPFRLRVSDAEMKSAKKKVSAEFVDALKRAHANITEFHHYQRPQNWVQQAKRGHKFGVRYTPIEQVGLYVPGGRAIYPSTVLMNAIPAKVAGVKEIIMVVPTPDGVKNPLVLAAAVIAGVDRVFTIGGAQAVGALAYGTDTIPQVDKIVGPGNAYVAAAKRRVFGTVGIDMIAGPSEILVICDGTTPPDWVAMDLFSQAEHDELAQSILLCPDGEYLDAVLQSIARLLPQMPRQEVIRTSLTNRGALIQVRDMDEACEIANRIAPEHLEISAENPDVWADKIRHAGAMFLGRFTSESLGDYCAGPNHVLPTSRTARFSSPLGVYDFQKRSSVICVSEQGAQTLGKVAAELAYGEGLQAHARSAEMRLKDGGEA